MASPKALNFSGFNFKKNMIVFYYLGQDREKFLEFCSRGVFTVFTEIPLGIEGEMLFSRKTNFPPSDDKFSFLAEYLPSNDKVNTIVEWEKLQFLPNLNISLEKFGKFNLHSSDKEFSNFRLQPYFKNFLDFLNDINYPSREKFFKKDPKVFLPDIFSGKNSDIKQLSFNIFESRKTFSFKNPMDLILFNTEIYK